MSKYRTHAFIPDTQITKDSDIRHIEAAANYIAEKQPDVVCIAGDWWDMPSLSSYDKAGAKAWEFKNVREDIDSGKHAMSLFLGIIAAAYSPEVHFFEGNHEERVQRAANDPNFRRFADWLDRDECFGFSHGSYDLDVQYHNFLKIKKLDGILYSHYFVNPDSLTTNPIGGTIENKLRKIGHSFTMGHQQHKQTGSVYTSNGQRRVGLVCGRFYQEDMEYLGPQKSQQSWSGIIFKHEVRKGEYDLMEVSMNYLLRNYS